MAHDNRAERRRAEALARRNALPKPERSSAARPRIGALAQANALVAEGQLGAAFDAFLLAIDAPSDSRLARAAFAEFLVTNTPKTPHPDIDPIFIVALEEAWIRSDALIVPFARYLAAKSGTALATELPKRAFILIESADVARLLHEPLLRV